MPADLTVELGELREDEVQALCARDPGAAPADLVLVRRLLRRHPGQPSLRLDREHWEHLRRKRRAAMELEPLFRQESLAFVWENLMTESIDETVLFEPGSESFRRAFTLVRSG